MLFVVDVGNTNITYGVYDGDKLVTTFRMMSKVQHTSDEYGISMLEMLHANNVVADDLEGCIIASVVPNVMHSLIGGIVRYLNVDPMIVGAGIKTGIKIVTENPKEIGPDRIVDAVGAFEKYGGPILVLDFASRQRLYGRTPQSFPKLRSKSLSQYLLRRPYQVCRQVLFTVR